MVRNTPLATRAQQVISNNVVGDGITPKVVSGNAEAARALLTVLRLRGIALSDDERAQILNQNDPSVLERWHERAVVASSIAEVFQMAH